VLPSPLQLLNGQLPELLPPPPQEANANDVARTAIHFSMFITKAHSIGV